jgi:ABC-2 type transport system ATP-binding protein
MLETTPAASIRNVIYLYGERRALDNVSFTVSPGEFSCVLGPNGGGKTTLFRILATLASPSSGSVTVFGDDVVTGRDLVRHHIGVVFQAPALDVKLTVRENLLHHGHLHSLSGSSLRAQITHALERLDLNDRRGDLVETLSGGLKRRVELAKVMLTKPQLLLLDEPTTGLDPLARESFWLLIKALRRETGAAVLYTTHLLEEAGDSGRVIILDKGRVVADGAPALLRGRIAGQVVSFRGRDLEALKRRILEAFALNAEIEGDSVRVVVNDGGEFAARAGQALGDAVDSLQIARPTLYDVFRQCTGHSFADGERV